ncbi:MAG: OmpA family protein [Flavobacteriales bacterium]|jgi:peptidoglycan-associated lipoprotein|nr:OmpA family protein [Flavobacteriales bacterium]MDG1348250.1 OmpA family protein [Flavobacteriales bacterium]|tara:strand:+ start:1324 stop:3327 length:2004 start_codon:yes stop_codon:yes gene_type:complete
MKRILRLLAIFVFLFSLAQTEVYAQKKSRKMIKADNAFNLEQYVKAAELYKKAYKKTKNRAVKAEIIFKQAECYRMSGNIKRAESYYKRAIKAKYPDVIVYLRYADVLRMQDDLAEAKVQYTKYMQLNPTDVNGEMGLKSCDFALKWKDLPTRYKVELMPLVNSRNSDYSPAFGNGEYTEMYFTSSRKGGLTDKLDDRTGETFSDVWFTKINKKGKWSLPIVVAEPINTEGNEGSVVLNKRGTVMYLTQCKVEKKKALGCGIYVSKRKGKLWGAPELLQIKIDSNTTIGHPALSEDETILIFSSDMLGGYGGKDLWMSIKGKRNRWSDPINLGPMVNTPGDEMFPFLHSDGTIYFSSNGHVGMGGLDVYKTSQDENGAYKLPVNLKSPVNSSADDFSMIIEKDGERGYLTSNRDGGKGGDDIYQFELPPLQLSLKGVLTDSKTGGIMTGIKVQLIGNDGTTNEVETDNTGSYEFTLKPLTSYEIVVNTEGYLNKSVNETTVGVENNKVFVIDFSVDPVKKEVILPRIEYDFNKFDLRPQSIADLDLLAETLKDNLNVVIELKSHTDYIGSNAQNNKLSQQRADACVAYLISQGIDAGQLVANGMGEKEPFVIETKDGRFKEGDVLTESYIKKIRFKKNKEKANQYNRRTSFKVLREDYVPASIEEKK